MWARLYRLTPGSEAVLDMPEPPEAPAEGGSKQLRGYPVPLKVTMALTICSLATVSVM